jgi:hypothetical protein
MDMGNAGRYREMSFLLRHVLGLAVCSWGIAASCSAQRVYQFVDYPVYQHGHTLTGTITTTDDAPLDSILDEAEILDWHINITGQYPLTASRYQYPLDFTEVRGIRISDSVIELPLAVAGDSLPGRLLISESTVGDSRGAYDYRLSWFTRFDAVRGTLLTYGAFTLNSDVVRDRWFGDISARGGSNWLIATAVPEPCAAALLVLGTCFVASLRLHRREWIASESDGVDGA